MVTQSEREKHIAAKTAVEHSAILRAVQLLERALASPSPGRAAEWRRRAEADFRPLEEVLRRHIDSAEAPGGMLEELELLAGSISRITEVRSDHERLLREARGLIEALAGGVPCAEARELAASLTAAIRAHQAREADLLLEAFGRDIGVGD